MVIVSMFYVTNLQASTQVVKLWQWDSWCDLHTEGQTLQAMGKWNFQMFYV